MEYLRVADYIVIVAFLAFSSLIGLYHAFRGRRQTTADEYLLADRSMNPFAVIFSTVVNVLSSITYLGNPAEVYLHGPQYLMVLPAKAIPILMITTSFVPIYYNLGVTSIYEYLRIRFGKSVQFVGVAVNSVILLMMLAINVYAPALALNAVTGLSIPGSIITVGLVCTLYTSLGGMKAVLWTGVFQVVFLSLPRTKLFVFGVIEFYISCKTDGLCGETGWGDYMKRLAVRSGEACRLTVCDLSETRELLLGWRYIASKRVVSMLLFGKADSTLLALRSKTIIFLSGIFVTIIACTINVGGITEVFRINARDGRDIYLDFRPSPGIRHTFWSVLIGLGVMSLSYNGTNQITVQRYMTCKSLRQAKLVSAMSLLLIGVVQVLTGITGLFLYAYFAGCDPLNAGTVQKADQIMAYIAVDLFHDIPGLTGFLTSAIFSASLGNVSTGINSIATMIGQDIIKSFNPNINDLKYTLMVKSVALLVGGLIISLAFIVSAFGPILEASATITGILNGPLLGVFMLGIYFPWSNTKGALAGMVSSMVVGSWLKTGALFYPPVLNDPPRFIDQCPIFLTNSTESSFGTIYYEFTTIQETLVYTTGDSGLTDGISLYSLSYAYYTLLTTVVTIMFGLIVSYFTHPTDPASLDPELLSPWTRRICHIKPRDSNDWKEGVAYHRANESDIQLKEKV
ncbi:Sodium-coupled monocarboxylate transporter 2 [Holothuria leucospilota]|uniref:Sodium-coupled monocarboxylate transporter 2 n=1 Tax=Holothuria leucospilota TaxID=206669 RepID=A0A9Q1BP80_HOLLE|nr:Sodium-coupled monocarboxylate transporter 2 [Holothuria leucospilota]